MPNENDLGLETLLSVRAQLGVDIKEDLLRKCFEIQRRHQYNHDRTSSSQAIEKLIEVHVDEAVNSASKNGQG